MPQENTLCGAGEGLRADARKILSPLPFSGRSAWSVRLCRAVLEGWAWGVFAIYPTTLVLLHTWLCVFHGLATEPISLRRPIDDRWDNDIICSRLSERVMC